MAQEILRLPSRPPRPHAIARPALPASYAERHPETQPPSLRAENLSKTRIRAASLAEKLAKLQYAQELAKSFGDKIPVEARERDLRKLREKFQHRHITSIIFAILENNLEDPFLMEFLQKPDSAQFFEEVTKAGAEIEEYYAHQVSKIGDFQAMSTVGKIVSESDNSTPSQIFDILNSAGYSPDVSKRIVKLLDLGNKTDKITVGSIMNLLAGRASELTAAFSQLLFHDQLDKFFNSIDSYQLLALGILSLIGVYTSIHIKNNASIHAAQRCAEKNITAFVPDPTAVYADALMDMVLEDEKGVRAKVKRNIGKWVGYFSNPLNLYDEWWNLTPFLPENGLQIFITGNAAAIIIKLVMATGVEYISYSATKNLDSVNSHANGNGKNGIRNLAEEVNPRVYADVTALLEDKVFRNDTLEKCRALASQYKFENELRRERELTGEFERGKIDFPNGPFVGSQTIYSFGR